MALTPAAGITVETLLRLVASRAAIAEMAPDLALTGSAPSVSAGEGEHGTERAPEAAPERTWLGREGFAGLSAIAEPERCAALVRAVEALRARELPATFVYAFDDVWTLGERARERVSAIVGQDYRLADDVWAWQILPGGGRGWPAHRGVSHVRLDRDAPEIINVWVALTDVTAERACMHAIPLDEDPAYPGALDSVDAPLASARAMPAAAGDALFWNANVLHWGGACSARAIGPRVSCSFTLLRADAIARFAEVSLLPPLENLDLTARMDAVARMILLYGGADRGDVSPVVREWAAVTDALASRFGARKAP